MRKISFFILMAVMLISMVGASAVRAAQTTIPGFSQISTNPYIVDDLPISVDAVDAVKARELAFEKALQTGFTIILERLYPDDTARAAIKMPTTPDLGKMLQDFTTRDEQVGAKQYSATFQLRYRPGRVQKYLQSSGAGPSPVPQNVSHSAGPSSTVTGANIAPAPTSAAAPAPAPTATTAVSTPSRAPQSSTPIMILPFFQTSKGQVLWAGQNPLRDAVAAVAAQSGSTLVPAGDAADIQIFDEKSGIRSSPQGFQSLMSKYQSNRAIIVIGVPDSLNASSLATKMTLMFYGSSIANPTPVYLDSIVASVDDVTQNAALFTRAAQLIGSQVPSLSSRITMDSSEPEVTAQSVSAPLETLPNDTLIVSSDQPTSAQNDATETAPSTEVGSTATMDAPSGPGNAPIAITSTSSSSAPTPTSTSTAALPDHSGSSILVRFNTMTEWNDIRTRLKSIPGITTIQIQKLKAQEATISLPTTTMTPSAFEAALTSRGLTMTQNDVMVYDQNGSAPKFILTRTSTLPSATSSDLSVTSTPLDQSRATIDGR